MTKISNPSLVMSSQVTFIYIALFTMQIVSKQLHSDNMKIIQHRSKILLNIKWPQLASQKPRRQWQGTKTPSGDRMEKKPRLSRGPVLLWPTKEQFVIWVALQDKLDRNIKSICPFPSVWKSK